jgi:hypothetical protein
MFNAEFKYVEKSLQVHPIKVSGQQLFHSVIKNKNSISLSHFADRFFCMSLFATFLLDSKLASN